MPLMESIRSRFARGGDPNASEESQPRSRQIRSSNLQHVPAIAGAPPLLTTPYSMVDYSFDPQESVPSYETSQMMHERQSSVPTLSNSRANSVASIDALHMPFQSQSGVGISQAQSITHGHSISMVNMHSHSNSFSNNHSNSLFSNNHSNSMTNMSNHAQANTANITPSRERPSLKQVGLNLLNARQHFALAFSRDVSLIPPLIGLFQSWKRIFIDDRKNVYNINLHNQLGITLESLDAEARKQFLNALTGARLPEHFLTGLWCIVAGYLSYSVLDGLITRWIVTYSTSAAIVRVLSLSAMIITIEQYLVSTFSADGHKYGLHIWILICCLLTCTYIVQNFVTSNLDLKKGGEKRARFFDFYNIVVFAVVPVGFTSFITMIGLLRSLLIVRIDIDQTLM